MTNMTITGQTKRRYRVYFTNSPLVNNGPLDLYLQVQAKDADEAARITKVVTGCECVLSVERIDDEEPS